METSQDKFENSTDFTKAVFSAVKKIPLGKVTTYKLLAKALGRPRAIRAVASALKKNPDLITTPCHRVIRSDGRTGGYCLGPKKKLWLLKNEGIKLTKDRVNCFEKFIYRF
ncbi:MAG: MGMT family protein [Patescibacteria group bacterium]|jgi:O-6-methylguanine DNA methyltransferase